MLLAAHIMPKQTTLLWAGATKRQRSKSCCP
jgi:hypothetical protein